VRQNRKAAQLAIISLAFSVFSINAYAQTGVISTEPTGPAIQGLYQRINERPQPTPPAPSPAPQDPDQSPAASFESAGQSTGNTNTIGLSNTVLTACAGGANTGTQFQTDCNTLVGGSTTDPSGASSALKTLTPDQVIAQNNAAAQQVQGVTSSLTSRMGTLRLASQTEANGFGSSLVSGLLYGQTGGAASADALNGKAGGFLTAKYLDGTQDPDRYTYGYDSHGWTLTAGGDYRLGPNLIAGAMISYLQGTTDYDQNKGDMTMDGWGLGAYGTYYLDSGLFLEGTIGYNWNDYDVNRNIDYNIDDSGSITRVRQTAKSSPDGKLFYATLGGGYSINRQSFTFTPQLSVEYIRNHVNSFRESLTNPDAPGSSWALAYDSQSYTSLTSRLGMMAAKAISTQSGIFVPQISIHWIHEFENDQEGISARFINDLSATPLTIWTTKPDHDYFDLGLGLSGQFANGRSAFISYNTILGYEDVSEHAITGGVRLEF
jgi:outer membrane autotransporter protein